MQKKTIGEVKDTAKKLSEMSHRERKYIFLQIINS